MSLAAESISNFIRPARQRWESIPTTKLKPQP
jgi:hypothetical protein